VGNTSDTAVAEAVISGVTKKERVSHVAYTDDTAAIKEELAKCELVACTRLHAMVSCIAMGIPFIPVIYEVKMEHILDEIGYENKVYFSEPEGIEQLVTGQDWPALDAEKLERYIARTAEEKERLLRLICESRSQRRIEKTDHTGPVLEEKQQQY